MPMYWCYATNWPAVYCRRAEVRALLIAKGLKEGCGKWHEVFARYMRK